MNSYFDIRRIKKNNISYSLKISSTDNVNINLFISDIKFSFDTDSAV